MSKKNRNKRSQNKVTPPKSPVKKMVLPTIGAVAVVCLLLFLFLGNPFASKVHQAEITVTDYGVITLELDENAAPETVKNFISLAEQGFYDWTNIDQDDYRVRKQAPFFDSVKEWTMPD